MSWLLFLTPALAGFGGAGVEVVGEFDRVGPELLVDIRVEPYQVDLGASTITWVPTWLSWGVLPAAKRLDHLEASVLLGERAFTSGRGSAWARLGTLRYDQEEQLADIDPGAAGVRIDMAEERLEIGLGADLRLRFVETTLGELFDAEAEKDVALLLGIPVGARWEQEIQNPFFAAADAQVRPALGLLGTEPFAFDARLGVATGIHAIEEDDAALDIQIGYQLRIDTFTALDPTVEHRFGLGALMAF
jgi:hypothetical protein